MKKFFYLAAIMFAAVFASCSDDHNGGSYNPPTSAASSWTVMFYSVGGANLDADQVGNMAEAFMATANDSINMTFQFKFSKGLDDATYKKYKDWGCFRFDMKESRAGVGTIAAADKKNPAWMEKATLYKMQSSDQADMSRADSLANFIKWSMAKHPASHYMLILSDHGINYDITCDPVSKSILADDNIKDSQGQSIQMSMASIKKGLQDAGFGANKNLDVFYADACLMAQAEYIYEMQDLVKYYIAAEEETPGEGGDYTALLNDIISSPKDAWTFSKKYVDDLTDGNHWKTLTSDCGVYDVNKTISGTKTPISGFAGLLKDDLAGTNNNIISKIDSAVIASQVSASTIIPTNFSTILEGKRDQIFTGWKFTAGGDSISAFDIARNASENKDKFLAVMKADNDEVNSVLTALTDNACYGLTLARFMSTVAAAVKDIDADKAKKYQEYHDTYIKALQDGAYLKTTAQSNTKTQSLDPYEYTSMSANVFALKDENVLAKRTKSSEWLDVAQTGFKVGNMSKYYNGSLYYGTLTAAGLLASYNTTQFGSLTKWGDFLGKLTVNPGIFINQSFALSVYGEELYK